MIQHLLVLAAAMQSRRQARLLTLLIFTSITGRPILTARTFFKPLRSTSCRSAVASVLEHALMVWFLVLLAAGLLLQRLCGRVVCRSQWSPERIRLAIGTAHARTSRVPISIPATLTIRRLVCPFCLRRLSERSFRSLDRVS